MRPVVTAKSWQKSLLAFTKMVAPPASPPVPPVLTRVREYDLVYVVSGSPAQGGLHVVRRDTGTGVLYLAGNGGADLIFGQRRRQ